jgi:pyruvate, orthophosphate dikinase
VGSRRWAELARVTELERQSRYPSLEELMPALYQELIDCEHRLEQHFRDMQDLEFTIQQGKLWMLQTRNGKRTAKAALRIAVDMAQEGLIEKAEAVSRIDPASLDQLLHPTLDPKAKREVIATGLPASPGAASGEIVFDADEAERLKALNRRVILVRIETSPEDIHGMHAAEGILTTRGGMTSHAAVVARGMGKPCVSGAGMLRIDYQAGTMSVMGESLKKGDIITIDGSAGQVMRGEVATIQPELSGDFAILMSWADGLRRMGVRANAETPLDARTARDFGAEGIGLCRTEHMFFEASRIQAVREMILADKIDARRKALAKLLPMQRDDFIELFGIMAGLPVTIRLLDPPLHEFLPHADHEIEEVAEQMNANADALRARVAELKEFNPMLGHRGVRLLISYPEIAEMQARAIFEAATEVARRTGKAPIPEVMVPLVASKNELDLVKHRVVAVAEQVAKETGVAIEYLVGTMIELPRAALMAADIALSADFFSFGTNDLTQTTFGISRDDAARFIGEYTAKGVFKTDPFISLDIDGVGELVRIGTERGRQARPGLKTGICGEHGGDPASIAFCESIELDYVSCSPFRVPIARLAAAQASLSKD